MSPETGLPGSAPEPGGCVSHAVWDVILSAMEADLQSVAPGSSHWVTPTNAGVMPEEFAERARELLDAQGADIRQLQHALSVTGRHLSALRSIPVAAPNGGSVYLDVTG